jgi:uncharacterized protein (DUF433 family)
VGISSGLLKYLHYANIPLRQREVLMKKALSTKAITHFHITTNKAICSGSPIIKGTRTSVANIAGFYLMGLTAEEIQRDLPHLTLAQVFDALAFYLDHRREIDRELREDREDMVSSQYPSGKF